MVEIVRSGLGSVHDAFAAGATKCLLQSLRSAGGTQVLGCDCILRVIDMEIL